MSSASQIHRPRHAFGGKWDVAIRWGGEEFLIVLPRTSGKDALNLAERLRDKCRP
ncbi:MULTISPECIES: diguanylate cyclase domain-containing protein [unclassified Pseudomonas]|uniref:diguanylate cyclase domain-containing protein n=1 Tax=unclassified Pseudomonas TaxID=196821 RepID=UPI002E7FBC2A|nr:MULTISPECIES: diguanylate cyclase [unclassified Pseudomonas]